MGSAGICLWSYILLIVLCKKRIHIARKCKHRLYPFTAPSIIPAFWNFSSTR